MSAPKGNEFWKLRKDFDGDGKKLTPVQVFEKSQEYVDYSLNNPLMEVDFRGKDAQRVEVPKMRAMSVWGLCHHIGISEQTLTNWEKDPKYLGIITQVKQMLKAYKFDGAAAGLLHANIIARDLGLADKKELDHKSNGEPITGMQIVNSKK